MKGFLLVPLGLLLVMLASPSNVAGDQKMALDSDPKDTSTPSSVTPKSPVKSQSNGAAAPGTTTQTPNSTVSPGDNATSSVTPGATNSSQGTTQPNGTVTQAPGTPTQTPNSTLSPGDNATSSVTPGATNSSQGTTQPNGIVTQAPGTPTQTPNSTVSPGDNTTSSVTPGTTNSSQGTTQPNGTVTQAPGTPTQTPNSTVSPGDNTTSSVTPGTTNSSQGTTQPNGTVTQAPGTPTQTPNSTLSPGDNATSSVTAGATNSSQGTTQPNGTVTQAPGVPTQTSTPGTTAGPCEDNPCGKDASCISLNTDFFCLCGEGYYYNDSSSSCMKGKTFPGEIEVTVNETAGLEDKNSKNYQDLYNTVVPFFKKALNKTDFDYGQTIILGVSTVPSRSARSAMRDVKNVIVSVVNMFGENTTQNQTTISNAIAKAAEDDKIMGSYTSQPLCDYYGCVKNDKDNCQNAFQCTCQPGKERPNELTPFCLPSKCPGPCSEEDNKQCIMRDNKVTECVCLPGYQKADDKCEACPFGYSGVDCKDQFQLILTIVGTIAAAIILILLIAFIVSVRSKKKNRNVEEQKLIEDDAHSVRMQQTGFSNFGASNSIFPKVRTGIPSQTSNPYANQRSTPRPDY